MKTIKDFESYNSYLGLVKPLDSDINIGCYDFLNILLKCEKITVYFYRISLKFNIKYANCKPAELSAFGRNATVLQITLTRQIAKKPFVVSIPYSSSDRKLRSSNYTINSS